MNNRNLIHGILLGRTGDAITSILDKVDAWNDMSISARNDSWRMGKQSSRQVQPTTSSAIVCNRPSQNRACAINAHGSSFQSFVVTRASHKSSPRLMAFF